MNLLLLLLPLTVLLRFCRSQEPVSIEFQTDPVLVQTGTTIVFTVITLPDVVLVTWGYPGGSTPLAFWVAGTTNVNDVLQYQGRVSLTRTQLSITSAQLEDAGSYTVEVSPSASTNLATNSRSVQLRVFEGVSGVSLAVPPVAVEGRNISLSCTWATGTDVEVAWNYQGAALTAGGRISITVGSLVIDPGNRGDAGEYLCTVSNPVSARSATQRLTVYYGPDTPVLTKDRPVECVGGGDAVLGQSVTLTCVSESLPAALFSWQHDGQAVAASQPDSGVLGVQAVSANQSGRYTCQARNAITGGTSEQATEVDVVQTCLSGGEVAGIVIGSLAALILIILLILLLVRWKRADQMRRNYPSIPNRNTALQPEASGPAPLGSAAEVHGSDPPLHQPHYTAPQRYNHQQQPANNNNTLLRDRRTPNPPPLYAHHHNNARLLSSTAGLPQRSLPDGMDNPHSVVAANTLSRVAPGDATAANILIQGAAPEGTRPPTVQVNLSPQPGEGVASALHFNLNFPPGAANPLPPQTLPGAEAVSHTHLADSGRSYGGPRMQRSDPAHRVFGREEPVEGLLVPTGYSHRGSPRVDTHTDTQPARQHTNTHPAHQHSDTHADRRDRGPASRSGEGSRAGTHSQSHAPWDLLRGTPAYPNDPPATYDGSDYTTQNPPQPRETRASEPRRATPVAQRRQEVMSDTREAQARPYPSPSHHSHDAPRSERERPRSHTPRQTGTEPRGHVTQLQPIVARSLDTRALADPNHLPQTLPAQTQPSQHLPQIPVALPTTQHPQGNPSPLSNRTPLTQVALQTHTQRAQTFQNRNQQTQAALQRPPTPPQVLPMSQFEALPRERTQDRSPGRPALRPAANLPTGQRLHGHAQHTHHPRTTAHPPQGHHAHGHHGGHHNGNPHQHQAPRQRPR